MKREPFHKSPPAGDLGGEPSSYILLKKYFKNRADLKVFAILALIME
jgi:hypothetical protein